MAEARRPVAGQAAHAQRQHPRPEVAGSAGQDQEPGVVGDQVQPVKLDAEAPADPPVARAALQCRCREHRERQPLAAVMGDIAQCLADPRQRTEVCGAPASRPETGARLPPPQGRRPPPKEPPTLRCLHLRVGAGVSERGEDVQPGGYLIVRMEKSTKHKSALAADPPELDSERHARSRAASRRRPDRGVRSRIPDPLVMGSIVCASVAPAGGRPLECARIMPPLLVDGETILHPYKYAVRTGSIRNI